MTCDLFFRNGCLRKQPTFHWFFPPLLGQELTHREPNIIKKNVSKKSFFFSREHCALPTILRKSLLSPVFLAVSPFLGTGEYEESLGLIDYLCFVCNVWHPLQFLVSYCRADLRGFSVYLRNLEVAEKKKVKNRNNTIYLGDSTFTAIENGCKILN